MAWHGSRGGFFPQQHVLPEGVVVMHAFLPRRAKVFERMFPPTQAAWKDYLFNLGIHAQVPGVKKVQNSLSDDERDFGSEPPMYVDPTTHTIKVSTFLSPPLSRTPYLKPPICSVKWEKRSHLFTIRPLLTINPAQEGGAKERTPPAGFLAAISEFCNIERHLQGPKTTSALFLALPFA